MISQGIGNSKLCLVLGTGVRVYNRQQKGVSFRKLHSIIYILPYLLILNFFEEVLKRSR